MDDGTIAEDDHLVAVPSYHNPSGEQGFVYPSPEEVEEQNELIGGNDLEVPFQLTTFKNIAGRKKALRNLSLAGLARLIRKVSKDVKFWLPLLSLCTYGLLLSSGGSLKNAKNIERCCGVEGDYDGGKITPEEAAQLFALAGIMVLIFTSPSHLLPGKGNRWRVIAPFSKALSIVERAKMLARINGLLGGLLDPKSFTPSQGFYYGSVGDGEIQTLLVSGDYVDQREDLDEIAVGPRNQVDVLAEAQRGFEDEALTWEPTDEFDDIHVPPEFERHKDALGHINPDCPEPVWWEVCKALYAASEGADWALRLFVGWSRGGKKYKKGEPERKWARCESGNETNEGTLFFWAMEYGWSPHGPKLDANAALTDDMVPQKEEDEAEVVSEGLTFLTPDQCGLNLNRPYAIKNFIAPKQIGCIFGDPGAGKSLIGPDLSYRVAMGLPVFEQRTKPGLVLYVAAEDPDGLEYRIRALRERHGHTDNLELVGGVNDLFSGDSGNLKELVKAVRGRNPTLVVIDTMAMAFPGLEENDAASMGRVVAIARELARWGAAVILIHHGTKADGTTPRGHSLFNGALDVAIHLKPKNGAGIIYGRLTKNRNGTCDIDVGFTIGLRELGRDDDGEVVRAAYAEELPKSAFGESVKLTRAQRGFLSVFDELGGAPVDRKALIHAASADDRVTDGRSDKARKDATRRALNDLLLKNALQDRDGKISRVNVNAERAKTAFDASVDEGDTD